MNQTYRLTCYGLMTALAFVSNYIRFPFLGSQIAVSNAVCALCGLILGPAAGFVTAGLGSLLYDLIAGYGLEGLITFVSKGAVALVAALLAGKTLRKRALSGGDQTRLVVACAVAGLTYVALYMLKTWIFKMYVEPVPADTIPTVMVAKLIPSLINAAFAVVTAPIFLHAVRPPLKAAGIMKQLEK
jgi:uncharacterized membrane protein